MSSSYDFQRGWSGKRGVRCQRCGWKRTYFGSALTTNWLNDDLQTHIAWHQHQDQITAQNRLAAAIEEQNRLSKRGKL